jgi:hypothetical protein
LAPSVFHRFGPLKHYLGDKSFAHDEEVDMKVWKWLRQECCGFRRTSKAMVQDMSRNIFFLHVRISHILCFITICDLFSVSPSYVSAKGNYVEKERQFGDYGRYVFFCFFFCKRAKSTLGESGEGRGRRTDVSLIMVVYRLGFINIYILRICLKVKLSKLNELLKS